MPPRWWTGCASSLPTTTPTGGDSIDWRILLEADFLVNAAQGHSEEAIRQFREKVFRTGAGTRMLDELYLRK